MATLDPALVTAIIAAGTSGGAALMTANAKRKTARVDLVDRMESSANRRFDELEKDIADLRAQVGRWVAYGLASATVIAQLSAQVVQLGGAPVAAAPPLPSDQK